MGFCDLPVASALCSVGEAVDFASDPGKAIGDWLAKSAGEVAATAADLAAEAVDSTTSVDLNAVWFIDNYRLILPIGLVLLVATFCAQLLRAAIRRDGQALSQAFTGTASGVIFAFAAVALTTVAIEVVDALSAGLLKAAHLNISSAVRRIIKIDQLTLLNQLGWLVMVLCALGAAVGAILWWCVMLVRKIGILVMVTLAVFAGAGGGWEAARRWRRGWIEATATLVASKLLMTIIFVLGIAAMGKADPDKGLAAFADVLAGIVVLVLVLICPYATFKFVHWASEGSDGESLHRAGGAGATIVKQHAERAAKKAASAAMAAASSGAGAGAGAGSAAPQGPDASPGGGFPGDVAPGGGGDEKESSQDSGMGSLPDAASVKDSVSKAVQPPPMRASDDTSGQVGGSPGSSGSGESTAAGPSGGWQSTPPSTPPPPQGAPPSASSRPTGTSSAAPPPPPSGP
ncbi:ATP-binding protein [Streptomyces sp. NPDC087440]|uniref:SCO6881 family protein n=1 Tax=Streptomyces sp. NPDC087440 TaxID=3365790 RepID=UPI0037F68E6B